MVIPVLHIKKVSLKGLIKGHAAYKQNSQNNNKNYRESEICSGHPSMVPRYLPASLMCNATGTNQ